MVAATTYALYMVVGETEDYSKGEAKIPGTFFRRFCFEVDLKLTHLKVEKC
jgi:hypothetical protein